MSHYRRHDDDIELSYSYRYPIKAADIGMDSFGIVGLTDLSTIESDAAYISRASFLTLMGVLSEELYIALILSRAGYCQIPNEEVAAKLQAGGIDITPLDFDAELHQKALRGQQEYNIITFPDRG